MTEFNSLVADVLLWLSQHIVRIGIALSVGVLLVLFLMGLRKLMMRGARKLGGENSWPLLFGDVIKRTRLWFFIALAARLVQGYANPPEILGKTVSFLFIVAASFQAAIWARSFIVGLVEHRANNEDDNQNLISALAIIRILVSFVVFAIASIFLLDNLGVNVTGLIAGLGVGGIAIGLAAQGIFSDLFAALAILFDQPFRVGDTIAYQGKEGPVTGRVEQIGLKSTRIRALTGELRVIANAQLLNQELTNFAGRRYYRMVINIGVIYQTAPDLAETIPSLMRNIVEQNSLNFVRSNFSGFGASSLDFELIFEAEVEEIDEAKAEYQKVAMGLLREFHKRGITFAYPTQTTFTAAPDGAMIMPYLAPGSV